jgi:hypothetical protein
VCRRERSSQTSAATCKPPGWRGLGERPPYRAISRASENNRVSAPQSADSCLNLPPSTYLARERDLLEPHVVVGLIPGGSSDVALCADLASLAHNHFDRCDLLRRRVIHNGARTGLASWRRKPLIQASKRNSPTGPSVDQACDRYRRPQRSATAMIALKQLAFSLAFATAAVAAAQYIMSALNGQP